MATITSLSFAITSTYSGAGLRRARRDMDDFDNGMTGMSKAASNIGDQLTSVTNAALLLGPALIPIGVAAAGVAGGLVASTAAAGAAAGIFGGALFGAITKTIKATKGAKNQLKKQEDVLATLTPGTKAYSEQLKKVHEAEQTLSETLNNLTPAQHRFSDSIDSMGGAWADFISKTEKDTLTPTSIVLDAVSRNLGKFVPVIKAVSPLVNGLAKDFAKWMDGKGLDRFIKTMIDQGVPALHSFIEIGRDVVTVLGKGFRDFLPFGNQVVGKLAEGADRLKGWANGGGFQRFLDRVHEVAPSVKDFFLALTDALKNIAKAAGDLSGTSLSVLTILIQTLALLPPALLANLVRAWLLWNAALVVYNVVGGIAAAVTAAMALAAAPFGLLWIGAAITIGLVVLALAALAVGIFFLIKYWDQVSSALSAAWDATWNFIKDTALTVWDFLTHGWGQFLLLLMGPLGIAVLVWKHWDEIWGWIKDSAFVVWDALKTGWSDFTGWLSGIWNTVWPGLLKAWHGFIDPIVETWHKVWPEAQQAAENVWNILTTGWNGFLGGIKAGWDAFVGFFSPGASRVWGDFSKGAQIAWAIITALWNVFWTIVVSIAKVYWAIFQGSWSIGWAFVTGTAKIAWATLVAAWNILWTTIVAIWNVFANTFKAFFVGMWNVIVAVVTGIWNIIKAAWIALWKVVTAIFLVFFAIFTGHWGKAWNAIKDAGSAIWNLIVTAWQAVWGVFVALFQTFASTFMAFWSSVWAGIAAVGLSIWDGIKSVFATFLGAVSALWDATWGAMLGVWNAVWGGIKDVAMSIYSNIIQPIIDGFMWLYDFLVGHSIIPDLINAIIWWFNFLITPIQAAIDLARTVIVASWQAISAAVIAVWSALTTAWNATANFFITIWNAVSAALSAAWSAFWAAIQAIASAVWAVFRGLFQAFVTGLQVIWTTAWNAIRALFQVVVNAIVAIAVATWNGIRTGVQAFLTGVQAIWNTAWTAVRTLFQTAVNGVVTAATAFWTAIRTAFSAGSAWLLSTFWSPVSNFFTKTIPNAFDAGAKALGAAWGKIKKLVRDPIQAVVDIVYNNGIRKLWNLVAGVFGADKLDEFKLPQFAKGGPTGNGSRRGFAAILHPNEHVWTSAEVKAAGGHDQVAALRESVMGRNVRMLGGPNGRFDDGGGFLGTGIGPKVGPDLVPDGIIKDIGSGIASVASKLKDVVLGGVYKVIEPGIKAAVKAAQTAVRFVIPGSPGFEDLAAAIPKKIGDTVLSWIKGKDVAPKSAGGGGTMVGAIPKGAHLSVINSALKAAGVPPPGTLAQWQKGLNTLITRESGWNPNAINNWDSNAAAGMSSRGLAQVIPPTFASNHVAGTSSNIYDPVANVAAAIRYITRTYGNITNVQQADASRPPAGYALGTPGAHSGWATVGEYAPERVRFRGGERVDPLTKLVGKGGGGGDTITITIPISGNADHGVVDRLERETIPKLRMALQQGVGRRR